MHFDLNGILIIIYLSDSDENQEEEYTKLFGKTTTEQIKNS